LLKVEARGLRPIVWRDSKEAVVGSWLATPGPGAEPVAVGVVSVATRKPALGDMPPVVPLAPDSGFLGVGLADATSGARIGTVMPGGAAAKAGVKVDDVVVAVAGKRVPSAAALISRIQRYKVGDVVVLKVKRGDKHLELKAKLERRPRELFPRADIQNQMGSKLSERRGGFPVILQHDTVIKPTDCGGPLVGLDGRAVGINIARAGRTESYAIPSEAVRALLPELKSGKLAPKKALADKKK
jgi:serine protease Do